MAGLQQPREAATPERSSTCQYSFVEAFLKARNSQFQKWHFKNKVLWPIVLLETLSL